MFFNKRLARLEEDLHKLTKATIELEKYCRFREGFSFKTEASGFKPDYNVPSRSDIKVGDPTLGRKNKEK